MKKLVSLVLVYMLIISLVIPAMANSDPITIDNLNDSQELLTAAKEDNLLSVYSMMLICHNSLEEGYISNYMVFLADDDSSETTSMVGYKYEDGTLYMTDGWVTIVVPDGAIAYLTILYLKNESTLPIFVEID